MVALVSMTTPVFAAEPSCGCPEEGHTLVKRAVTGLGRPIPPAQDQSLSAAWRVYELERDGVLHLQVTDATGVVRFVVGQIGTTVWRLPMGSDVDRVSTPQRRLPIPAGSVRTVVYRSQDVEIVAYNGANGVMWAVEETAP
ncbi:hypothetical protein [Luteimonas panaciterrae]|uniref:hypothetical protein n=1 Tax=Luteimonas panaciterrae TaxID=363885 RepID=UPI001CFC152D|nr:hypothetical protein [Luteimonas panaciterrae]